ncbi:hypothetical protein EYC80_006978 [Monilinia laxa]|uniref:Uncharacterized protein n=1 Tax=Monilinia laxa TaxID=61186 RepID=A0A5N6K072_MONLA|nr:hypothetical protein EYC80_006978 [Monilinia laxa]
MISSYHNHHLTLSAAFKYIYLDPRIVSECNTIHTPIHHTPYTIHHTPYTIHHTPYTIHHTPYTIHTIHHTPYTIHHTPYTIHHITLSLIFKTMHLKCHNLSIQLSFIKSLQIQIPIQPEQPFIPFRIIYLKIPDQNVKSDHKKRFQGIIRSNDIKVTPSPFRCPPSCAESRHAKAREDLVSSVSFHEIPYKCSCLFSHNLCTQVSHHSHSFSRSSFVLF